MGKDTKKPEEIQGKSAQKAAVKHRKLNENEIQALKCSAPSGKRELAPGKSFCVGSKSFKSALFSVQPDKDGNEELKRDRVKFCYVPEALAKDAKIKDGTFLSK